ncbi:MAG: NAD(P)/FAD-dependent oxidoreductase [Egibacteraceae bacterium]
MLNRVVIVGGGIEGLSCARELSARGAGEVVVLERGDLCGAGTGKSSGVVRCHYGVASLAAMAWHGVQTFERAAQELGGDIGFVQTGYVVAVAERDVAALQANVALHRSLGIDVELADRDAVAELWPDAHLDDFAAFAWEPRGGYGDAYRTGQAFAAAARRDGALIRQHAPVAALCRGRADRVTGVELADGERIDADTVIVAAGPWSPELCAPLGVELPIRAQREQILMVAPGTPLGDRPVFSDLVSLQYVRTERSGELLVGNSDHSAPEFVDPDAYGSRADDDFVEAAAPKIGHRFPRIVEPRLSHTYAGCYDVTPDFNPIMSATQIDGLFVCAGFSGHGFKISPAVGRLMADLVLENDSTLPEVPAKDFRLARYAEGDPLVSTHRYVGAGQMR